MITQGLAYARLSEELEKYGKLYIAFDFDNTIFDYHNQGLDCSEIIKLLQKCSDLGFCLILFTCTEDEERLTFMKLFCKHYKIKISYINENPEVFKGTSKPYYNILLDDRAGLEESFTILNDILKDIVTL